VVGPGDTVFDALLSSTVVAVASEPAPGNPSFALEPNIPNPFYAATGIGFTLSAAGPVTLRVYDIAGRMVTELIDDQWQGAGRHELQWNGRDRRGAAAASGVYFLRLNTPLGEETRKITLAK
jgi:flagellar hook capping protein FlgD